MYIDMKYVDLKLYLRLFHALRAYVTHLCCVILKARKIQYHFGLTSPANHMRHTKNTILVP